MDIPFAEQQTVLKCLISVWNKAAVEVLYQKLNSAQLYIVPEWVIERARDNINDDDDEQGWDDVFASDEAIKAALRR